MFRAGGKFVLRMRKSVDKVGKTIYFTYTIGAHTIAGQIRFWLRGEPGRFRGQRLGNLRSSIKSLILATGRLFDPFLFCLSGAYSGTQLWLTLQATLAFGEQDLQQQKTQSHSHLHVASRSHRAVAGREEHGLSGRRYRSITRGR